KFVGIGYGIALVKENNAMELFANTFNQTIGNVWFNQVPEAARPVRVQKIFFKGRRANVYRQFCIMARDVLRNNWVEQSAIIQFDVRIIFREHRIEAWVIRTGGKAFRVESRT